ncbi:MAG: hypothetical protein ACXVI0_11225 [Halobacteriota archaeon]
MHVGRRDVVEVDRRVTCLTRILRLLPVTTPAPTVVSMMRQSAAAINVIRFIVISYLGVLPEGARLSLCSLNRNTILYDQE